MVFKRSQFRLKPGHVPWNKGMKFQRDGSKPIVKYIRLSSEDLNRTIKRDKMGDFIQTEDDISKQSFTYMLLRPKKQEQLPFHKMMPTSSRMSVGHRIMDMEKLLDTINDIQKQHGSESPGCGSPAWELPEDAEVIRGLAVTASFRCKSCKFMTTPQKLFREVPSDRPGRKQAVPNMALQVGLYQTSVCGTAIQRILTALSTPSPVMSSLQQTSNQCGEAMVQANQIDMQEKRRKVQDVIEYRGMERNTPITVEMDRQYNTPLSYGRRRTPFQPATQARDVVVENETTEKYVIAYNQMNKLCRFGQKMIKEGKKPLCPNHPKCSANIRMQDSIGDEKRGGEICANQLLSSPEKLLVGHVITDTDGHFADGMCSVMKEKAGIETEPLLCTIHLNRSLARTLSKVKLSKNSFPGKSARIKQKQQMHMADDIVHRFQAELKSSLHKSGGNISKCEKQLCACVETILPCYVGQHYLCKENSMVCKGKYNFPFLSETVRHKINLNFQDCKTLNGELLKRLTPEMLRKTRTMPSTQKAESMNSAFRVTSPKNTATFTRNCDARNNSAIQLTNSGPGAALLHSASTADVPLFGGRRLRSQLSGMQSRRDYWRKRSKQGSNVSRAVHRQYKYRLYEKEHKWNEKTGYVKGKLEKQHLSVSTDHNYARRGLDIELSSDSELSDIA